MAQTYNFPDVYQGASFKGASFTILVNSVAEDLTGVKIEFIFNGSTATMLSTTANSVVITNAASGEFDIPEQIIPFSKGTYSYIGKFTYPNGKVKVYLKGELKIL